MTRRSARDLLSFAMASSTSNRSVKRAIDCGEGFDRLDELFDGLFDEWIDDGNDFSSSLSALFFQDT